MNQKSELEIVKANVRSLIQSQTNGIYTIQQLEKDYKYMIGHPMPLLGRKNVEQFLHDMPDVVKICGYGPRASLQYVPNEKSKHIGELVKQQKSCSSRRRGRRGPAIRRYQPERVVHFPEYSDESDWDIRSDSQQVEEQEKINKAIDKTLDDDCPNGSQFDESPVDITNTLLQKRKLKMQQNRAKAQQITINGNKNTDETPKAVSLNKPIPPLLRTKSLIEIKTRNQEETAKTLIPKKNSQATENGNARFLQILLRNRKQPLSSKINYNSDEEEAIPASAVNNIIDRLNSAKLGDNPTTDTPISDIMIPCFTKRLQELEIGQILPLYVKEVFSPLKFYFQLHDDIDQLTNLTTEMQNIYNMLARHEYCLPENHLHHGMVCAAYYNEQWYRARILSDPSDPNEFTKIKLCLVDEGTLCELTIRHLKLLAPRFSYVPAFAIRGSLAYIKHKDYTLDSQATSYFRDLACASCLYGYIASIESKPPQVNFILLDTSVSPKRQINNLMINNGFTEKA